MNEKLFNDFIEFSKRHKSSGDIDPVYLVFREVNRIEGLTIEQIVWRTLLYVAWYRIGSSEIVFKDYPEPSIIEREYRLPTGIERRGFRGNNKAVEMINDFMRVNNGVEGYLHKVISHEGEEGWMFIRDDFEKIKNNGGWASYKWADLMKNVVGLNITANSIGGEKVKKHSPVQGLQYILECDYEMCKSHEVQRDFYNICKTFHDFNGLEEFETSLCDFKSLVNGNYYVGRDIDEMLDWLPELGEVWIQARKNVLDDKYLGEVNGWDSVNREKLKVYKLTGKIV